MSSRKMFYAHATVVVLCMVVGMSESFAWLSWARVLFPLVLPLMVLNLVIPFATVVLAIREDSGEGYRVAAAVGLSAALSIAGYFTMAPLFLYG